MFFYLFFQQKSISMKIIIIFEAEKKQNLLI